MHFLQEKAEGTGKERSEERFGTQSPGEMAVLSTGVLHYGLSSAYPLCLPVHICNLSPTACFATARRHCMVEFC